MQQFHSESELIAFLEETFGSSEVREHPGTPAFVAGFVNDTDLAPKRRVGERGAVFRKLKWVIQTDDLAIFKSMSDGVKAAAAAGFFVKTAEAAAITSVTVTGAVIGVIFALYTLLRQALKKGAILDDAEIALLTLLATSVRALPVAQIAQALGWDEDAVANVLGRLENVRLADGQVKAFVAADAEQQWGAIDVGRVI